MKNCIEDKILEKMAIGSLDSELTDAVARHVAQCRHCSSVFAQYREFYRKADEYFQEIPDHTILKKSGQVTAISRKIILHPLSIGDPYPNPENHRATLAADTDHPDYKPPYEKIAVFIDTGGDTLGRLIYDKPAGKWMLYIISDEREKYEDVLVRLLPVKEQYLTNEYGQTEISPPAEDILDDMTVEISTPSSVFDLTQLNDDWETLIGQGSIPVRNSDNRHIEIEFLPGGDSYTLKIDLQHIQRFGHTELQVVAVKSSKQNKLTGVYSGVALIRNIIPDSSIQIKIYS